jgi:hypothetical protein
LPSVRFIDRGTLADNIFHSLLKCTPIFGSGYNQSNLNFDDAFVSQQF